MRKQLSDASKRKAKQKWIIEKPKLDNARQLRAIFFIEPDDEEFRHTIKNARRKLEIPMPAAMLCNTLVNCRGETCRNIGKHKTKYACIVDADESVRKRQKGVPHRYHEDHISAKGSNSLNHYNLEHKFIPMPLALKIPGAKAAVEKGKTRENPGMAADKIRNKKEVIEEARNKGRKIHFASLMDLCHLKNSELEPQFQKYKGRVVLRGDIVKDDSGSYAVFIEQGSSASQTTDAKVMDIKSRLPGCAGQAADAVSAYTQVKMEDAPSLLKNSKVRMSRYLDTSPKHKWPKSWSNTEDQLFLLSGICTVILWHDYCGKRQFEKVLLGHGWVKVRNWECLFVNREKGLFLSVYVDDIKTGWQETDHQSDLENSHERR